HLPFKKVFETYSRTINAYHAHNSFIQTFAELGFAGFVLFMVMLLDFIRYPIMKLINQTKYINRDKYFKYIGAGVVAGIIGVFTHGLAENVLYLPKIIFSFWTLVGIGAMAVNIVEINTPKIIETKDQVYKILRRSESDD
ncbi:MAG: polymerase, partial [Tissierellia bacterium]|nr:polymerase [Tissierellia bacterium]